MTQVTKYLLCSAYTFGGETDCSSHASCGALIANLTLGGSDSFSLEGGSSTRIDKGRRRRRSGRWPRGGT